MARYPATLQIRMSAEQHAALSKLAKVTKTSVPFIARWYLPTHADKEMLADLHASGELEAMHEAFVDERVAQS